MAARFQIPIKAVVDYFAATKQRFLISQSVSASRGVPLILCVSRMGFYGHMMFWYVKVSGLAHSDLSGSLFAGWRFFWVVLVFF